MQLITSVIICTHNRANELVDAITSVLSQGADPNTYEVIVVDNASTDRTPEIVRARAAQTKNLRYLLEPALGLSCARNAGLHAALGKYIAYVDDDAIAEPGWLAHIPEAFAAGSNVGCVAGKIEPIWGAPRPAWLDDRLLGYVSVLDCSPVPTWLNDNEPPFGANVIYSRDALIQAGGFSTSLGRKGSLLLSNEDILVNRKLRSSGYRVYYDPRIAVRHRVPAARLTATWMKRRAYWQGVSDALLERELAQASLFAVTVKRLRCLASLARNPREILAVMRHGNDPEAFTMACRAFTKFGYATAGLRSVT